MATLLRFAARPGSAPDPDLDRLVGPGDVSIGRSATCDVRLLRSGVAFRHALLREEVGGLKVEPLDDGRLRQGGAECGSAVLASPGDAVQIGPYELRLESSRADSGYVLLITPVAAPLVVDEAGLAARYARAFDVKLPNVRLIAFSLCCGIAALLFILPLTFSPSGLGARVAAAADRALAIGTQPAVAAARLSMLWNVGAFSSAHGGFGGDCAHCHRAAFAHVPSAACLDCHRDTGQHAMPAVAPMADLRNRRCETCHHEHKGLRLATADKQADCVACHGAIHRWAPHSIELDVRDFAANHPQFAPALVQDAVLHTTLAVPFGAPEAADHSGLRFTHATHLKLDTLNAPGNAACAQCHTPLPGGVTFQKVEFYTACARCHALQFEPRHPEWRLPHGQPEEISSRIRGYYSTAALAGEVIEAPRNDIFKQPGARLPQPLQGAPLVSAEVAAAMMSSIARSACGQCHVVTPPVPGAPADAWNVAPVFVNDRFFPQANFSHAAHATSACSTCHAARKSDAGPLALLPRIETCRLCHAGEAGATQRVASTCVLCHGFHDARRGLVEVAEKARPRGFAPWTRTGVWEPQTP